MLSLLGLALRRSLGTAWTVLGLAATVLLWPAWVLPDGVPSPAATLAQHPPWEEVGDPDAGNPSLVDVTYQIQPWLLFLRQELRAGRLPFWNPHQFSGAPFWSNGQSAPLFPLHLLFALLPLELGFFLLPWLRLVLAGCGAWALGRELGLGRSGALVAGLSFSLSGMPVSFALYPMGNALTLVPWILWSVERMATGKARWRTLAVVGGLQCLAGHPETVLHTALLSALYVLVRGAAEKGQMGRVLRHFFAGWLAAAAMGAVQILPLVFMLAESSRWQEWTGGPRPPLGLVLELPLRLVLPNLYGHPAASTWFGPFFYSSTAVYLGAPILPLAVVGGLRAKSDRRFLALAFLLVFSFAGAYHLPGVHEALQAVPLVGRALHHRLLFAVALTLSLLAGAGVDRWRRGRAAGLAWGGGGVILLLAVAWWRLAPQWQDRGLLQEEMGWTALQGTMVLVLVLSLGVASLRRWLGLLLPLVLVGDLTLAHARINGGLSLPRLYPETAAVRWLQGPWAQGFRVTGVESALRPNAALVYGLYDIRGDDPLKFRRYEAVYGSLASPHPFYFRPVRNWQSPWLDRLGVRWIVAGPHQEPASQDWRLAYQGTDARVYERPSAEPLARWVEEPEGVAPDPPPLQAPQVRRRGPGAWDIVWKTPSRRRLLVAESWARGWRAKIDGRQVPVELLSETLMGVSVGPGSGELELRYRPAGIGWGALLTLSGLLSLAWGRLRSGTSP